jgi:DNA invertase Pin-like site-specific DNA recombinase
MTDRTESTRSPDLINAAQYIRMSTEHQQYSPQNQSKTVEQYAALHGMRIVRTYIDSGRSGLRLAGRDGLRALLEDVATKQNDFEALLVYDVSRWGRFQDVDESAYYEFLLKKSGILIHYCAEQFLNDGSPLSNLYKTLKRTMAAEYSRELSVKVFAGQCRLIELGYRQGGLAGFGLRRVLVDKDGNRKTWLATKEYKSLHTDRVILVPGPKSEVAVIKRIYGSFITQGKRETQIAEELNFKGVKSPYGKPWAASNVHEVLVNAKYAGVNVYNQSSFKLKQKHVRNPPEMWVQREDAFEGIVSMKDYLTAKEILRVRNHQWTNDEMIDRLRDLLKVTGKLSNSIIDKAESIPRSQCYTRRFGGLRNVYAMIGCSPIRNIDFVELNRVARQKRSALAASIEREITNVGGSVTICNRSGLLTINQSFTVLTRVARCIQKVSGLRWRIRLRYSLGQDLVLVARLNLGDDAIRDYYILPSKLITVNQLHFTESNGADFEMYRFDDLNHFYDLCGRKPIGEAK